MEASLHILFQDRHLVAVNKPSGLLVHRSDIDRHETRYAMRILRDQLQQWVYPLHRIDKPTSGVLVFALDPATAGLLTEQFTQARVEKTYLAVVRGHIAESGTIDHPLKEHRHLMRGPVADVDRPAQEASTEFERLATTEVPEPVGRYQTARFSLVRVRPLTGRTHQIRRHMKHIFHPVIGDTTHGDGKQNAFFRTRFDCSRMLLHALSLRFTHPYTNRQTEIEAPLDDAWTRVMQKLGWQLPGK